MMVFGESGLDKILRISEVYRHSARLRINEGLNQDYGTYSPWFGLFKYAEEQELLDLIETCNLDKLTVGESYFPTLRKIKKLGHGKPEHPLTPLDDWDLIGPESDLKRVRGEFEGGISLISKVSFFSSLFESLVNFVIPLDGRLEFERGFSDHRAKGAIFLTPRKPPFEEYKIGISIAHEIGHQVLMLYQTTDDIIPFEFRDIAIFSAIRERDRPCLQVYHALFAISFMHSFLRELLKVEEDPSKIVFLNEEKSKYTRMFEVSYAELIDKVEFTRLGVILLEELKDSFDDSAQ